MRLIELFEQSLTGGVKARRKGNIAVVDELWVPPEARGEGHGVRLYQQWERNLPDDITVVRLMPVDYGAGDPTGFWEKMGFRFVSDKWMEKDLTEAMMESKGLWTLLKKVFPNVPDYVMKDLVYPAVRISMKYGTPEKRKMMYDEAIKHFQKHLGKLKWRQETLDVTKDIFNTETRQRLAQRAGGRVEPGLLVPRDTERHDTQKQLIAQGPSQEPIIVVEEPDGYDLWEGWHRTIQSIAKWPNGYKQVAWVGYK